MLDFWCQPFTYPHFLSGLGIDTPPHDMLNPDVLLTKIRGRVVDSSFSPLLLWLFWQRFAWLLISPVSLASKLKSIDRSINNCPPVTSPVIVSGQISGALPLKQLSECLRNRRALLAIPGDSDIVDTSATVTALRLRRYGAGVRGEVGTGLERWAVELRIRVNWCPWAAA